MVARGVLIASGWLLAAAATAALATGALTMLGTGILGPTDPPLTADEVASRLASAAPGTAAPGSAVPGTTAPAGPGGAGQPSDGGAPVRRVLATPGGTIVAECSAGAVWLVSWSPAQGYRTDDVQRGPAAVATVTFKGPHGEVTASVTCPAGQPTADTTDHD